MSRVKFEEPNEFQVDYAKAATEIVDVAISEAISQYEKLLKDELGFQRAEGDGSALVKADEDDSKFVKEQSFLIDFAKPIEQIPNIEWMKIENFSKGLAEQKIEEFIKQTWKYEDSWLYCIDYLGENEEQYDMRYHFRVKWSIPTRRKPIPRSTASVYFTFSVSKIKPGSFPVDVFFVFEGNRLVHRPGKSIFREKWLKDVIESKIRLYENITF